MLPSISIRRRFRQAAACWATCAIVASIPVAAFGDASPVQRGATQSVISAKSKARFTRTPVLPSSVQRALDKANVKPGRWRCIVLHHSGVDCGTVQGMDRYHRQERHMVNGLAYHFVIGNGQGMGDGEIAVAPRWVKQLDGGHLASEHQNKVSLGICLVGNFDGHKPTSKQMRSLTALVRALMTRCRLSAGAVKTHQQINVKPTRCPGRYFPTKSFMKTLRGAS